MQVTHKVQLNTLTLSFLAFLQKLFMVVFEMLFGSLPILFRIVLTLCSITRKSASALAWQSFCKHTQCLQESRQSCCVNKLFFKSTKKKGQNPIIGRSITNSVEDVISGIDPSRGASPPPSFSMNSCKEKILDYTT